MKLLPLLFILTGCVTHQWVELPNSKGGHDTYHAYLEKGTVLEVQTEGVGLIKWDTKPAPGALEQMTSLVAVSLANSITSGN